MVWGKKRHISLEQQCYETTKNSQSVVGHPITYIHCLPKRRTCVCGGRCYIYNIHLNVHTGPNVCSYDFVEGKPTPELPILEKWLSYKAPVKQTCQVLERVSGWNGAVLQKKAVLI
ncbi:hypothetical protein SRHO_G00140480 [Serrasalmus rhombeus]